MSEVEPKAGGDGATEFRDVLRRFVPSWHAAELCDDLPLGSKGLGLDSIAILELFVACEQRFHVEVPDSLLDGPPLTVGILAEHIDRTRSRS